ncbi:hypothetical protein [Roseibium sp.]|uniref:hypothetical protein n=1 Tax=Roseibium sp. TaxID=1936156 RepID=UPI003BAFF29E
MARVRSPAYPALSLPDAVEMVRKVYELQQTTPEPRSVVIRHMGYTSENGRALKALSALIKYGFLDKASESGLRVSPRAIAILFPDPDHPDAKHKALFDAAREPSLFNEFFDRWENRPSLESLKAYLVKKGFNLNSVENVARAFYETYDLVSDLGDSYDSADPSDNDEEGGTAMPERQKAVGEKGATSKLPPDKDLNQMNVTKPLFDFETVSINTIIDNQQDLEQLITRLQQIKSMLPEKTQH